MRFKASAFVVLALLLFGDISIAETGGSSAPATDDRGLAWSHFVFEEVLLRSCDDPTLETALALPQPKLILEATDDGQTKVKARFGGTMHRKFTWNLEVTSPRDPSGETTLASLDGLSSGSTAKFAFSWVKWNPQKYYDYVLDMMEPAKDLNLQAPTENGPSQTSTADVDAAMKKIISSEDTGTDWRMTDYLNPAIGRPSAVAVLGSKTYKEAVKEWRRKLKGEWIPAFTLEANAEQKDFQFIEDSSVLPLTLGEESHTDYQLTASIGAYYRGAYGSVNYRRGDQHTAGRTTNLCTSFGSTGLLDCKDFVVGPPKKGTGETLDFEIRRLFGPVGIAAQLTRDLQANVTAIEVPIYFLQKLGASEMELNGGVAVKWNSDTDDYSLSVFIGPALSTVLRMIGQ